MAPLWQLARALNDLSEGAKPELFVFDKNKQYKTGQGGGLSEAVIRARIVMSYEILRNAGTRAIEAGTFVAKELKRCGVKNAKGFRDSKGAPISARLVRRWAYEKSANSDKLISGFNTSYERQEKRMPRSDWPTDADQARRLAAHLIEQLQGKA